MHIGRMTIVGALLLAGCATQTQQGSPAPARAAAGTKAPLITKSAVFFPDSTADLELVQKYVYPDVADGVQITYRSKALPDAKVDFFVFVLGRAPTDLALKQGMQRVRGEIQAANKAGLYADTVFDHEADVSVKDAGGSQLPGRKLFLSYTVRGVPYLSTGYMFYKQLYYVEMRISTPARISLAALEQGADEAAAEAVPLIHIANAGGCTERELDFDPQLLLDPKGPEKVVKQVAELQAREGCRGDTLGPDDVKPGQGEHVELLQYTAADWQ